MAQGTQSLQTAGPLFGLGMAPYLASKGAGHVIWRLIARLLRVAVSVGCGWRVLRSGHIILS
jgi:hypothetical protein